MTGATPPLGNAVSALGEASPDVDTEFANVMVTLQAARRANEGGAVGNAMGVEQVPVTVLTGFLGSGKTTVLRRLLTGTHGLRVSAMVNDLAAVNIDAMAIGQPSTRLELANGCACCVMTDDLGEALRSAVDVEPAPDALVVEASGAADAVALAAVIEAEPQVRLDGIVGVVDALALRGQLADPSLCRTIVRQLEASHLILVSKIDQCSDHELTAILDQVVAVAPGRQVMPTAFGEVPPPVLLGAALRGAALPPAPQKHALSFLTRVVRPADTLEMAGLTRWLEGPHGLLRAKGWLSGPDRSLELQVVGRRWTLRPATSDAAHTEPVIALIADSSDALDRAEAALTGGDGAA